MRERFMDDKGKHLLREALRKQPTLRCIEPAIEYIADHSDVEDYPAGAILIGQGTFKNTLAFILSGKVDIIVNGRHVAYRRDGQHVGEMSVIDPSAKRSASVVAVEDTCVAWIEETVFSALADKHPDLWRALAVEIADRLRQRAAFHSEPNETIQVFIGSSSEALPFAESLRDRISEGEVDCFLWSEDVFGASDAAMESLEEACANTDFAIIVCTADDITEKRGKKYAVPRDNTIFELGLFMGAIGRKRTIAAFETGKGLEFPSDLKGITYKPISLASEQARAKGIDGVVTELNKKITKYRAK